MFITREELALHPVTIDETYPAGKFDDEGGKFHQIEPLRVRAVANLAGLGIQVRGGLKTQVEMECDRCVTPVKYPVEREFDLYYRPVSTIAHEEEIEIPRDELDVGFYSGEGIEVADLVREQVILALPMKVVCRPDCRGLCPVCGANLNVNACHCQQPPGESPFASLRDS